MLKKMLNWVLNAPSILKGSLAFFGSIDKIEEVFLLLTTIKKIFIYAKQEFNDLAIKLDDKQITVK